MIPQQSQVQSRHASSRLNSQLPTAQMCLDRSSLQDHFQQLQPRTLDLKDIAERTTVIQEPSSLPSYRL